MSWRPWRAASKADNELTPASDSNPDIEKVERTNQRRACLGILNDKTEDEVPGSILLLSNPAFRNEPLGLQNQPARTSQSSISSPYRSPSRSSRHSLRSRRSRRSARAESKRTADGKIILNPQPDDSLNDPLNWASWRRDTTLLAIGFYSMIGGGMTPILAAGFSEVADTYGVSEPRVALTTGLYMMGLGLASVFASPTAILYGKRPVYLGGALFLIVSSVWCALSPSYVSLLVARIIQGIGVSPIECLPSATVAEIFFLHERAYRLGIYTLLLLGGKNLVPLVSATVIQSLGWRWVFWIVAMIVGFITVLLFFFVPETFWDRTPTRHHRFYDDDGGSLHHSLSRISLPRPGSLFHSRGRDQAKGTPKPEERTNEAHELPSPHKHDKGGRVNWADETDPANRPASLAAPFLKPGDTTSPLSADIASEGGDDAPRKNLSSSSLASHSESWKVLPRGGAPHTPNLRSLNSPSYSEGTPGDYFSYPKANEDEDAMEKNSIEGARPGEEPKSPKEIGRPDPVVTTPALTVRSALKSPRSPVMPSPNPPALSRHGSSYDGQLQQRHSVSEEAQEDPPPDLPYTDYYKRAPPKSYIDTLKPFHGRLNDDKWIKVAVRPFILFTYPAVLWSAMVYSFSVGWLIVLSESVTGVFESPDTYDFSAIQCGLIYISPFLGGILGTAVAGKVSDIIVRFMAKKNDGIYEPEFRLVMAIPVALTTSIGLMGFGWSAQVGDSWIVPTLFFGIISFGCSLGSTTAITFCVDSYRQYAGEALVTLNFSKNIFHGLVFSLFFTTWLEEDGPRIVFIAIGIVQLATIIFAVPLYIYGKRARMWTVRKNFMEKF